MYYQEFNSFQDVWKLKNKLFIYLIISLFIFLLSIFLWFYTIDLKNKAIHNFFLYFMLLSEVFVLYLLNIVEKQRNDIIKKKFHGIYKNNQLSLTQIKRKWLRDALPVPNNEYISLIEKIEKYYLIESKYKMINFTREKIYDFIFSTDSKNRVLAMFMGLVALFTAMLISSGVNIEYIFAIFESINFFECLLIVFLVSLFLFGLFYIVKYTSSMLLSIFDFIFDNSFNKEKVSRRKREIFIAQLLQSVEFPKHRKRVYATLEISKKLDNDTSA